MKAEVMDEETEELREIRDGKLDKAKVYGRKNQIREAN